MKVLPRAQVESSWAQKFLHWLNLRPEEGERTLLMFAFYTITSVGQLWLEHSAIALFLNKYGAEWLPIIYIASALVGSGFGFIYSWLAKIIPLRSLLITVAALMGLPLFLFRLGLDEAAVSAIIAGITIFLVRLWMDAIDVLNDLNTSIAANQLFNIREIKRTYPIISSGILVADVFSGFSLPLLLQWVGIYNMMIVAGLMMLIGAVILYFLCRRYPQAFPNAPAKNLEELQAESEFTSRRIQGPVRRYVLPLFAFFILGQVLFLLVEFQYLGQLESNLDETAIAGFLGIFSGVTGLFELITQWFVSSRAIERVGVFFVSMLLPTSIATLSAITLTQVIPFFWGLIAIKFIDELFRYTLLASVSPVFFQPLPENLRNSIQASVRGIAQTLSTGATGLGILALTAGISRVFTSLNKKALFDLQSHVCVVIIIIFAGFWFISAWLLRSGYISLLVQSAQAERLGSSHVDLGALKRAVLELFAHPGKTENDKRSCIQLLYQIDPKNIGEVLVPLLPQLSPALQKQSLEAMLEYPNQAYLAAVQGFIETTPPPEIMALALRYVWLADPNPQVNSLKPYLQERVDPTVRSTAAALILRLGNSQEKAEATNTLERMLTSNREKDRVMGCQALGEAAASETLKLHISDLLQDQSLRVRCALLEVIANTRLQEYYPSLLRGLHYKSTKATARGALVELGNESIPLLADVVADIETPESVRYQALLALGEIGTAEALNRLIQELLNSWGTTRRNILRILLKMPSDTGIEGTLEQLGRTGIETLIEQELLFLGQIYAAIVDFENDDWKKEDSVETQNITLLNSQISTAQSLLLRALRDLQSDVIERCFLLMKFLYPVGAIQAAAFNLESDSRSNIALGLEILDNTVDLSRKKVLLAVLDHSPETEKLESLNELVPYQQMSAGDRLRRLLELRHFLSDWPLACCFHLARSAKVALTPEQTLVCLRHPTGFVREAVLGYLKAASPRTLLEMLPVLKNDADRLVAAQVQRMMVELSQL